MKKLKMARGVTLTFEEGCNKYSENCRRRNLSPYMFRLSIIYYRKQIFWGLFIAQTDFLVYN